MTSTNPSSGIPSKWMRLRNWQSHEFWCRLFARPLCILLLYPIADWAWVTPNLLTHLGNVAFGIGIWFLYSDQWIWAAVWLQIHLVLDHMDGTLARYRNAGTWFGFYYDKVSDYVGTGAMFLMLGWKGYEQFPDRPHLLLVGASIALAEFFGGYSKWLINTMKERVPGAKPVSASRAGMPPQRTPKEWILWFLGSWVRIFQFEEMDFFFWVGLALVIERLDWVLYLLCVTRVAILLGTLIKRGFEAHSLDRPTPA